MIFSCMFQNKDGATHHVDVDAVNGATARRLAKEEIEDAGLNPDDWISVMVVAKRGDK